VLLSQAIQAKATVRARRIKAVIPPYTHLPTLNLGLDNRR